MHVEITFSKIKSFARKRWKSSFFGLEIFVSPNSLENVKNPCGNNIFLRLRLLAGKRWKTSLFGLEIFVSPNSLENVKTSYGNYIF